MRNGDSTFGLVKEFTHQVKTFLREEVQLAKAEFSEKISYLGKNTLSLAIGGFAAYAGLIVLLAGIGLLLAFAFEHLGLSPMMAAFLGLAIVGFIVISIGGVLILKGIKAFKTASLAPKRTIETLQNLKGNQVALERELAEEKKTDHRNSDQIKDSVVATEQKMAETFEALGDRVTLKHFRRQADAEVRNHPYKWGIVAMGTGMLGSILLRRKLLKV